MTPRILGAVAIAAALAATPANAAFETSALNPPPPDWYTCKATGSGASCHGKQTFTHTGGDDGSCPQGFDILEDGIKHETARRDYDRDGNLVERVLHDQWPHDPRNVIYNSVTGKSVPYWGSGIERDTLTVPGDFDSIVARTSGNGYTVTVPGLGLLVKDAGRLDFAPDGSVIEMRGPKMLFLGQTEKLCALLAS
jgi:hypothetical protein